MIAVKVDSWAGGTLYGMNVCVNAGLLCVKCFEGGRLLNISNQ